MASLRTLWPVVLRAFPRTQPAVRTMLKEGNWRAAYFQKPFSSSLIRYQSPRSPRAQAKHSKLTNTPESLSRQHQQSPPLPEPEPLGSGSPTLIVGTVIAACVGLFAYTAVQVAEVKAHQSKKAYQWLQTFDKHFTISIKNVKEGRYYVFLTSTLAHANLTHLAFNMLALWGFGRTIVSWYGLPTFATIWVGSAVVGGVLQTGYWMKFDNPAIDHKAIGASGSLFGLVSALSFVFPNMEVAFLFIPMKLRWMMIISAAVSLASIKEGWLPWLGHVDHLGGMAFGAVWWTIALRRGRRGRLVW